MKLLRWLFLAFPLVMIGCSTEQDKTLTKATDDTIAQPTKQSDASGGGASGTEAKAEDRMKPEF